MGDYITIDDVRRTTGAGTDLISDDDITNAIADVEKYTERWLNCKFKPTLRIDILDGNGTIRIFTDKNPLLSIRGVKIDGTALDMDKLKVYKESGKIEIDSSQTTSTFKEKSQAIVIKYIHGFVDYSATETTSTASTTAGTDVSISVSSITDFSDGDWIEIYGMDGHREVAQINATPSGSTIQVDELVKTHESGSYIKKLEIPYAVKRFIEVEAGIYVAINAIGSTYNFNASYNLGEFGVVKGVPYMHWARVLDALLKERERIVGSEKMQGLLKPRPYIALA